MIAYGRPAEPWHPSLRRKVRHLGGPMRVVTSLVMLLVAIGSAEAQSPEPPLSDTRIAVHTLVREDVFAGFLSNDMVRFARAERNIQQLLKDRPDQRGNLLAWTGGAALYRS